MEFSVERPVMKDVADIVPKTLFFYKGSLYMKLVSSGECVEAVNLDSAVYECIDNDESVLSVTGCLPPRGLNKI